MFNFTARFFIACILCIEKKVLYFLIIQPVGNFYLRGKVMMIVMVWCCLETIHGFNIIFTSYLGSIILIFLMKLSFSFAIDLCFVSSKSSVYLIFWFKFKAYSYLSSSSFVRFPCIKFINIDERIYSGCEESNVSIESSKFPSGKLAKMYVKSFMIFLSCHEHK